MTNKLVVLALFLPGIFSYSFIPRLSPAEQSSHIIYLLDTAPQLNYKIIPAPNHTWGYDILKDNKIFIHQPNKPGLPGIEGFRTKADARKVAQLVMAKIKRGEMPPTVSPGELKRLKLTN